MSAPAYAVCLRLGAGSGFPELHSLWFEDEQGRNTIVSDGSRLRWERTEPLARVLANGPISLTVSDDPEVTYDLSETIEDLLRLSAGAELRVLNCLNFLDDLAIQLGTDISEEVDSVMVQAVKRLTEGESLSQLCEAVGGPSRVLELLYTYVGCVVSHSSLAAAVSERDV